MKRTEEELELINKYLHQTLSAAEMTAFETRLAADPGLAADVSALRLVQEIAGRQQIREQIQRIQARKLKGWQSDPHTAEETAITRLPNTRPNGWQIGSWTAAAAVALLLGFFSVSDVSYTSMSPEAERSNRPTVQDEALQQLDTAIDLLKNNHPAEAIAIFDKLEDRSDLRPFYRDAANWYEVVALQKAGEKVKARQLLRQIETMPDYQFTIPTLDKLRIKWKLLF